MSASRDVEFFNALIEEFAGGGTSARCVLVTHLLPDRIPLLTAFSRVVDLRRVIAIPYSAHSTTVDKAREIWRVELPSLEQLQSPAYISNVIEGETDGHDLLIVEIGGYFAKALASHSNPRILGAVEDTEAGHREYEKFPPNVPVISVARSPLKAPEDQLIGTSIVYSVESVLRSKRQVLPGALVLVLGFGKVGRSVAREARNRGSIVMVYDINPIAQIEAQAAGFATPSRSVALERAEVVIGTTGCASLTTNDLNQLRDGAMLFSGSSRRNEFSEILKYQSANGVARLTGIETPAGSITVVDDGLPVNFFDGAEVAAYIRPVQAECLVASLKLMDRSFNPGLHELGPSDRTRIAEIWLRHYGVDS